MPGVRRLMPGLAGRSYRRNSDLWKRLRRGWSRVWIVTWKDAGFLTEGAQADSWCPPSRWTVCWQSAFTSGAQPWCGGFLRKLVLISSWFRYAHAPTTPTWIALEQQFFAFRWLLSPVEPSFQVQCVFGALKLLDWQVCRQFIAYFFVLWLVNFVLGFVTEFDHAGQNCYFLLWYLTDFGLVSSTTTYLLLIINWRKFLLFFLVIAFVETPS